MAISTCLVSRSSADVDIPSLQAQIKSAATVHEALQSASGRASESRIALGDVPLEPLRAELSALGADPAGSLRKQRQDASTALDQLRTAANEAKVARSVVEERLKNAKSALEAANKARDEAAAAFPGDLAAGLASAQLASEAAAAELEKVAGELKTLDSASAEEAARSEKAVAAAKSGFDAARVVVDAARVDQEQAMTAHAGEVARSKELQQLLDAEDRARAESVLAEATAQHTALPRPERAVTDADLKAAKDAAVKAGSALLQLESAIQRSHGALQQVGGMVARDRLHEATEALAMAEQHEREVEADSEAWKLLVEQMKEAESAQASNLGQALAPAISGRFEELTKKRYDGLRLTNDLGTEGVLVGSSVRSTDRLSVGTREQLSTLYRLALAEYLQTAVVLDDQLVQSDNHRMDWFRALLVEKARGFQIVVFTCRQDDYLPASALVPAGAADTADSDSGFVRAIDLGRAVKRR